MIYFDLFYYIVSNKQSTCQNQIVNINENYDSFRVIQLTEVVDRWQLKPMLLGSRPSLEIFFAHMVNFNLFNFIPIQNHEYK